jgi:hypothetical protein
MFTSETLQVARASVVYGGGFLHDDAFQAVDYFHPAIIPDTEHVVVVSMPSLTELEQAILSRVPEEHSEMPGIFWPAAAAPVGVAVSANAVNRTVNGVWDGLEADEEKEEEDEREREAEEEEERTVEGEALEEIDRPGAEDVGAQDEIGQDFSALDETASAQTLLKIRMQLRKRR